MIRRRKTYTENFTIIDRRALEDWRLSFEARGVLAYLMSKPNNWEVSMANLRNEGNIGKAKAYRIVKELLDLGYMEKMQPRHKSGMFGKQDLIVSDLPLTGYPDPVKRQQLSTNNNQVPIATKDSCSSDDSLDDNLSTEGEL